MSNFHAPKLSIFTIKNGRLEYKNGNWIFLDGDGLKHSTNGTWLFAEEPYLIHDKLLFKVGNLLIKAMLIQGK